VSGPNDNVTAQILNILETKKMRVKRKCFNVSAVMVYACHFCIHW